MRSLLSDDYEVVKEVVGIVESKYGLKFNSGFKKMKVSDFVFQMYGWQKNYLMLVILSLTKCKLIPYFLNKSWKVNSMTSLLVILVCDEEMMKMKKKEHASSNFLITQICNLQHIKIEEIKEKILL